MTSQNPKQADAKTANTRQSDDAQTTGEQPEVKKALSDKDIAAVVGGGAISPAPPVNPADVHGK